MDRTVINQPYNQQNERISTTFKPLVFPMLPRKENGKIHREEFIAKLGIIAGGIVSALPRGMPKKQKQE